MPKICTFGICKEEARHIIEFPPPHSNTPRWRCAKHYDQQMEFYRKNMEWNWYFAKIVRLNRG